MVTIIEATEKARNAALDLFKIEGNKRVPAFRIASKDDLEAIKYCADVLAYIAKKLKKIAAEHRDGVEGGKGRVCWICDQCGAANDITLDMCPRCHATRPAPEGSTSE